MKWLARADPRRSIRVRLTLVGSATLLAGLVIGAVAFAQLFEQQLVDNLDSNLQILADDRARAIDAGLDPETQLATVQTETAVAVFNEAGSLLANRGFVDPSQLEGLLPEASTTMVLDYFEVGENEIERSELRLHAAQPGQAMVVVAAELEQVSQTVNQARALLAIGVPLITAAGAAILWIVVGRTLHPVDRMRRDALVIAELGGDQRVHDPETEDELGALASTLNDMLARLEANAIAMRQFVSDSSHEIRTPIANIRARLETAQGDDWAAARSDSIGEVERIERLIDDLAYLAASDEGQQRRSADRIELDDVLFGEAARVQSHGRLALDAGAIEPVIVSGDRSQIERAIRNLVANAERHATTAIRLGVTTVGDHVVIDVDDDGPGIDEVDRERIFERFVRLDESRQRGTGGTGLGLAIASEVIRDHGGNIEALAAPIGGARLRVTLPTL